MAVNEIDIIVKMQDQFSKGMKAIGTTFDDLRAKTNSLNQNLDKSKLVFAGIAAGLTAVAYGALKTAGEFEKYEATLKVMLGTTDAAKARLKELSDFAAKTPFALPEVVELGNQLQSIGRYSKENMTILGDLASAAGKPIEQVSRAFAKLATGQKGEGVNMFRELLISTEDWVEATGKGISKSGELMATTEEMIAALPKIMAKKNFTGMMEEQSKTFEGIMSNLGDSITRVGLIIGQTLLPPAKKIAEFLITLTSIFTQMPGPVQKFISIGIVLVAIFAAMIAGIATLIPMLGAFGAAFAIATGPIGLTVLAITGLGILLYSFKDQIFAIGKALLDWNVKFNPLFVGIRLLIDLIGDLINRFEFLGNIANKIKGVVGGLFGKKPNGEIETTAPKPTASTPAKKKAEEVDVQKDLKDFQDKENKKTSILQSSLAKRTILQLQHAKTQEEINALQAEMELQKNTEALAQLDLFYGLEQQKFAGNQEALAALDVMYAEQKLKLEQERIANLDALKDAEYERDKQRQLGGLQSFINMLDIKKAMTKSQAQDFANWQSFMSGAEQSKNAEVAAISKAMAIYDIGLKTANAAISAYSAMVGIPIVGPVLAVGAAGAAVAWGTEQANKVASMQPALAEGGMVRSQIGGQSVTVAEGGNDEAVVPLDNPEVAQRLQSAVNGGESGKQVIQLVVDKTVLAEVVVQGYNQGQNIGTVTRLK